MKPTAPARSPQRVAVITGSDRGIGLEVARQLGRRGYRVVLTGPNQARLASALRRLRRKDAEAVAHLLDVADGKSVRALRAFVMDRYGGADVLVNNAGIDLDESRSTLEGRLGKRIRVRRGRFGKGWSVLEADLEIFRATLEVNTLGALRMCQAFIPRMRAAGYGRVVNVSSERGSLMEMGDDGAPAYMMSKTALNALTRMVAGAVRGRNVLVNSVSPGWVRTKMGGPAAPRSLEKGARGIVWAATLPDGGPTGGFFRDGRPLPW